MLKMPVSKLLQVMTAAGPEYKSWAKVGFPITTTYYTINLKLPIPSSCFAQASEGAVLTKSFGSGFWKPDKSVKKSRAEQSLTMFLPCFTSLKGQGLDGEVHVHIVRQALTFHDSTSRNMPELYISFNRGNLGQLSSTCRNWRTYYFTRLANIPHARPTQTPNPLHRKSCMQTCSSWKGWHKRYRQCNSNPNSMTT